MRSSNLALAVPSGSRGGQIPAPQPCPRRRKTAVPTTIALLIATAMAAQDLPLPSSLPVGENPPAWSDPFPGNSASASGRSAAIPQELRLADAYLIGKGVPKDPVQSAWWYAKAAEAGDPGAQNQMGYFYSVGIGVRQDPAMAARWFARAMAGGSQPAKLNLAVMYLKGFGVAPDIHFALDLLSQAAAKGNARAYDYLGAIYFEGFGVPRNPAAAEQWFARSAKAKNPEGEYAMGVLYSARPEHQQDYARAAAFFRKSAHAGYVPAMSALGLLLVSHPEVPRKLPKEPLRMLTSAAEAGDWTASALLGKTVLDQDPREAFRWFTIAARQQAGGTAAVTAHSDLDRCRAILNEDQQKQLAEQAEDWLQQHPGTDLFVFDNGLTVPIL